MQQLRHSATRMNPDVTRQELMRLLQRAAAALIDAEEFGPDWEGYAEAMQRSRRYKDEADRLEALMHRAR